MGEGAVPKGDDWTAHDGGNRPRTGDRLILVRLRRDTREEAAYREPQGARWWPRWKHDGGSGDIIEWRYS